MEKQMAMILEIISISLATAPWLLFGLFLAGLIKAAIPQELMKKWVGGSGIGVITRSAVIGAPLPLCSCGAIPVALSLYRGGAGRGPATAFLIGTPGIGVDSILITYALLGPHMALMRALGAVITAICTGLLVSSTKTSAPDINSEQLRCPDRCGPGTCTSPWSETEKERPEPWAARIRHGMIYAFSDLLDDIGIWILAGLVVAGLIVAFLPPEVLIDYGSGLLPMLLMAVIGIPLYICAAAATPVGAGLLQAGVSPGTVLVFLLAAPITSMATLGVLRRELGKTALAYYLSGILLTSIMLGMAADQFILFAGIDVIAQSRKVRELIPEWFEWTALIILISLTIRARINFTRLRPF